jgi:hypothetical protein
MELTPVSLKFPALNKALQKSSKVEELLSPEKGITVIDGKAIVYNHSFTIIIDLYDYFVFENNIEDPFEIEELEKILFFMNDKVFGEDFWKEINVFTNMAMVEGDIFIETPKFSKNLHYKEIDIDKKKLYNRIIKSSEQREGLVSEIALSFGDIKKIYDVLGSQFNTDSIIFNFTEQDKFVRFTFHKRKYITGYIQPNFVAVQEGFKFEVLHNLKDFLIPIHEELCSRTPPPPPEEPVVISREATDMDNAEADLFNPKEEDGEQEVI